MPIKRSLLEKKWYYRVVKVVVLLFPILAVASALLAKEIPTNHLSNTTYVWVGGVVAYYIIVKIVWKIFLYIGFGGLEDDTKKKEEKPVPPQVIVQAAAQPTPKTGSGCGVFLFIMIMIITFIIAYALSQSDTGGSSGPSTGSGGSSGGRAYCNSGSTYNYSSGICCPNSAPHYYNGAHGIYAVGCYASCPYIGDCSAKTSTY